eukprot:5018541-Alexandrium_andersonii.AAC.1
MFGASDATSVIGLAAPCKNGVRPHGFDAFSASTPCERDQTIKQTRDHVRVLAHASEVPANREPGAGGRGNRRG